MMSGSRPAMVHARARILHNKVQHSIPPSVRGRCRVSLTLVKGWDGEECVPVEATIPPLKFGPQRAKTVSRAWRKDGARWECGARIRAWSSVTKPWRG